MKALFVALSLLLVSHAFAASESTLKTKVRRRHVVATPESVVRTITPQIGMTVADTTYTATSPKVGFTVGATVDLFKFYNKLTLETGLLYKQEGGSLKDQYGGGSVSLNYFTVPMAAKWFFSGERVSGFYVKGGFMPGINVASGYNAPNGESADMNGVNTFVFGLLGGVGGKIALSNDAALVLETNYVRDLTHAIDSSLVNGQSINNSTFSFVSGVAINM